MWGMPVSRQHVKKGMHMRKYLLAATAALTVATPAIAKDGSGYVGADIGAVWPKSHDLEGGIDFANPAAPDIPFHNIGSLKYKAGIDVDLIGGYDFGMFRLEGELGYKHGKVKDVNLDNDFLDAINGEGNLDLTNTNFDIDRTTNAWSGMINGWLDLGGNGP